MLADLLLQGFRFGAPPLHVTMPAPDRSLIVCQARSNSVLRRMANDEKHIEIPATCHPSVRVIYTYWLRKCGERPMPSRADLDPAEIPAGLLPGICLVDVVPDARRYVYRLVGTADVEVRGHDPTGKSVLDGFFGPSLSDVLANYDRVVSNRVPHIDPQHFRASNGRYVTEETIFLPLSEDGVSVNKILVFSQSREMSPAASEPLPH